MKPVSKAIVDRHSPAGTPNCLSILAVLSSGGCVVCGIHCDCSLCARFSPVSECRETVFRVAVIESERAPSHLQWHLEQSSGVDRQTCRADQ